MTDAASTRCCGAAQGADQHEVTKASRVLNAKMQSTQCQDSGTIKEASTTGCRPVRAHKQGTREQPSASHPRSSRPSSVCPPMLGDLVSSTSLPGADLATSVKNVVLHVLLQFYCQHAYPGSRCLERTPNPLYCLSIMHSLDHVTDRPTFSWGPERVKGRIQMITVLTQRSWAETQGRVHMTE